MKSILSSSISQSQRLNASSSSCHYRATKLLPLLMAACVFYSEANADYAPEIYQFDVLEVTSEKYNPTLPNPLTPYTAVMQMAWDEVTGPYQFKTSNYTHSGAWIGFVTETWGYEISPPSATYNSSAVTYFGPSLYLIDASNTVVGEYNVYYCTGCQPNATFNASTTSINTGKTWLARMAVR